MTFHMLALLPEHGAQGLLSCQIPNTFILRYLTLLSEEVLFKLIIALHWLQYALLDHVTYLVSVQVLCLS